jgi:hypothetical protein
MNASYQLILPGTEQDCFYDDSLVRYLAHSEKWQTLTALLNYHKPYQQTEAADKLALSDISALIVNFAPSKIILQYIKSSTIKLELSSKLPSCRYSPLQLMVIFGYHGVLEQLELESHNDVIEMLEYSRSELLLMAEEIMSDNVKDKDYYVSSGKVDLNELKDGCTIDKKVGYDVSLRLAMLELRDQHALYSQYVLDNNKKLLLVTKLLSLSKIISKKENLNNGFHEEMKEISAAQIDNLNNLLKGEKYDDQDLIEIIARKRIIAQDIPTSRIFPTTSKAECFPEEIRSKTIREVIESGIDLCKSRRELFNETVSLFREEVPNFSNEDLRGFREFLLMLEEEESWILKYRDEDNKSLLDILSSVMDRPEPKLKLKPTKIDEIKKEEKDLPNNYCRVITALVAGTALSFAALAAFTS